MAAPRKPVEPATPEQAAFLERAVEQHGKATYNFAFRLTRNETDARDLTQEAFIRVYRAWRSFKPGTSFLSWIYRIVTNLHRDELRRQKGRYLVEIPEDNEPRAFTGSRPLAENPIDEYVEGHLSEPVSKALGALTSEQRQIVVLADIEECSYAEIAGIVGCSVGTVRSRLHRARSQLRKLVNRNLKSSSS
jgi:RNA polymerase sigma factor (sigma-70 family)